MSLLAADVVLEGGGSEVSQGWSLVTVRGVLVLLYLIQGREASYTVLLPGELLC